MADLCVFEYGELSADDKKFLKEKVGVIRLLARQCAESVLHIGKHLIEVRERIKGRFGAWVEAEFSWTRGHAYKMIQAAEVFGGLSQFTTKFDASALFVLSQSSTPATAREYAISLAEDGEHVTHKIAREIIDGLKTPVEVSKKDVRHHFKQITEDAENPDSEPDDVFGEYKLLWTAFKQLILNNNLVTFSWEPYCIDDSNDQLEADPETHQHKGHFKVMMWKHSKDKPVVRSSTTYLETLILEVTDSHPMQTCSQCGVSKRLYEDFSSKKGNRFNRSRACKTCEVVRVAESKQAKKEKELAKAVTRPA